MPINVKYLLGVALALAALAGRATNPVTGRSRLMLVSGQEAVTSS